MKKVYFFLIIFMSSIVKAEIPVSKYDEFKKDIPSFKEYLVGIGRGIFWSNAVLRQTNRQPMFCMPEKLALNEDLILSLIDQEIKTPSSGEAWGDTVPVELIMVVAFKSRFPCK